MQARKEGYGQFIQIITSQKTPEEITGKIIAVFTAETELN
jgi:hypothetical protein